MYTHSLASRHTLRHASIPIDLLYLVTKRYNFMIIR